MLISCLCYGFPLSFCLMLTLFYYTDCAVEGEGESCCGTYDFEDAAFSVQRGDYAYIMEKVSQNLEKAKVDYLNHINNLALPGLLNKCVLNVALVPVIRLTLPMRTRVKCWRSM